ncbi:hypothetical protein [Glycomyces sp. YM15]|uniref:hypothetical protein n=1 Tax=Glycomyces sp. YM15 TaxID=2800446 RepID=UPI0019646DFB|nr:hypothetical protein [Glycomyces sp. YM15]
MSTHSESETGVSVPLARTGSTGDDFIEPLEARDVAVHRRIEARLRERCGVDTRAVRDCFVWNGLQSEIGAEGGPELEETYLALAGAEFAAQAARTRHGFDRALLCLWVHHSSVRAWNHTYRVDLLTKCMIRFAKTVREPWGLDAEPDEPVALALRLCDLVRAEILLEDRLKTGSRLRYETALRELLAGYAGLLEETEGHTDPISGYVRDEVCIRNEYHSALHRANQALAVASGGQAPKYEMRKDLQRLANEWQFSSVELSKLNAHRQALERLLAFLGRAPFKDSRRWMRVDEGRIVYLFPFGVTGLDYVALTSRLRHSLERRVDSDLLRPNAIHDHFTYHADIWEPRLETDKRFDGMEMSLPNVLLRVDDETTEELAASIRFSPMGVHCLRLERTLTDVYPGELHAAMFRAAREHGTIDVRCGDSDRTWDRLSRFARDLLLEQLPAHLATDEEAERKRHHFEPVEIHRGRSHVLIRVLRASERKHEYGPHVSNGGSEMVQDGRRLLTLVGSSVLLHAAPDAKESLWDWVRLADDHSKQIWNQRNQGDLLISTENTTVIAALDAPNFISGDLEAVAEFTACLSGTLAAWNHQLDTYRASVTASIAAYNTPGADRSAHLEAIKASRTRMLGFESETRQVISLLHSPSLLRSPSNAAALRRLLDVSGVDEQLETFEAGLGEVMADQSEATLQRWEGDRQQRIRDSLTAAVSALSVCAAISIWQAAGLWTPLGWSAVTAVVAVWAVVYVMRRWVSYYGAWATALRIVTAPVVLVRRWRGRRKSARVAA